MLNLLKLAAATLLTAALMPAAVAQTAAAWPSKPLRIIVAFPAGGPADRMARILGASIQKTAGITAIIESKVGGSGIVASQHVINANDGHTLFLHTGGGSSVRPHVKTLPYDPWKELAPVTTLTVVPTVFLGNPTKPMKSLADVVGAGKKAPGTLTIGVIGLGTTNHLYGEVLKARAGFTAINVPYTGAAPALQALAAGDIDLLNIDITSAASLVQGGKLVAYAIASEQRSRFMPDVPTTAEAGFPGVLGANVWGVFVPASMPKAHVQRLHEIVTTAMKDKDLAEQMTASSLVLGSSTPEGFLAMMKDEEARLLPLIKAHSIRMD